MSRVQNFQEKLHWPLYDSMSIKHDFQPADLNNPLPKRFFTDIQGKTKLDTNMDQAAVLPSTNTYEVRSMRLVVGPAFGTVPGGITLPDPPLPFPGELAASEKDATDQKEHKASAGLPNSHYYYDQPCPIEKVDSLMKQLVSSLVYNSVLTLIVGEKTMIQAPSFLFPAGAGVFPMTTHGEPTPVSTFRFAEPVVIDRQQNFRVELNLPQGWPRAWTELQKWSGHCHLPMDLRIWVVMDGFLTRDVQ